MSTEVPAFPNRTFHQYRLSYHHPTTTTITVQVQPLLRLCIGLTGIYYGTLVATSLAKLTQRKKMNLQLSVNARRARSRHATPVGGYVVRRFLQQKSAIDATTIHSLSPSLECQPEPSFDGVQLIIYPLHSCTTSV